MLDGAVRVKTVGPSPVTRPVGFVTFPLVKSERIPTGCMILVSGDLMYFCQSGFLRSWLCH